MLTNEQKALKQLINYIEQSQWEKLNLYCQIINPKNLLDPKNTKIFTALKYLFLEKQTTHPWNKIKSQNEIIKELLAYLQTYELFQKFRHFLCFKNSLRLTIKLVFFLFKD